MTPELRALLTDLRAWFQAAFGPENEWVKRIDAALKEPSDVDGFVRLNLETGEVSVHEKLAATTAKEPSGPITAEAAIGAWNEAHGDCVEPFADQRPEHRAKWQRFADLLNAQMAGPELRWGWDGNRIRLSGIATAIRIQESRTNRDQWLVFDENDLALAPYFDERGARAKAESIARELLGAAAPVEAKHQ